MCGIVGIIGNGAIAPLLVESISRLEYRGYDSCGLATLHSLGIEVRKDVGTVADVAARLNLASACGSLGIAHTRWATHGGVTQENAHPHLSCDHRFAVVHNGIISNHRELREELKQRDRHFFFSDTDTEVVPHLLEEMHHPGEDLEDTFVNVMAMLEGSFAIAMISSHDPVRIFCVRAKSPLILGIGAGNNFLASDVNAFLPYTRQAIPLEDGEYAMLSHNSYHVRSLATRDARIRKIVNINWASSHIAKGAHEHYMEKEIWEQPDAIARALELPQKEIRTLAHLILGARRTILLGVGTTYYASLFGQYLFSSLGRHFATAVSADEAQVLALPNPDTVLLAISQSGETFDTLEAVREAKTLGARAIAIVNVPGSSLAREADLVLQQNSGPEICVISTKAAVAQMVLLLRVAVEIALEKQVGSTEGLLSIVRDLAYLPKLFEIILRTQQSHIRELAARYHDKPNWFFLARGIYTPVAFESALKMKEVTYLHAEGMPAGFLKHGTLSLIEEETPCVFFIPPAEEKKLYELTFSSLEEVRARKGKIIAFGFDDQVRQFDKSVLLPKASPYIAPFLHLLAGQLLAYETAVALGRNVDRPRSLAKSVTVA